MFYFLIIISLLFYFLKAYLYKTNTITVKNNIYLSKKYKPVYFFIRYFPYPAMVSIFIFFLFEIDTTYIFEIIMLIMLLYTILLDLSNYSSSSQKIKAENNKISFFAPTLDILSIWGRGLEIFLKLFKE